MRVVSEPSQARARAWAPMGLLLVLACGAWFFPEQFQGQGPDASAPPDGGPIQPLPAQADGHDWRDGPGVGAVPGDGAMQATPQVAAQVLDVVAQRGRQAAPAASAALSAESLQARVRHDAAAVHQQTAGQRLRLQGTLAAVEAGEPGVVVLHLAVAGQPDTVRMVASPALAAVAAAWVPPKAVALDCLSQGVMMGEWLLVDCQP